MTEGYSTGLEALDELNETGEQGAGGPEFTPFKTGTTYKIKVLSLNDVVSVWTYSIFKKVNTFIAENPSKKTKTGFPIENLTPFDKAFRYYKDQSKEWNDEFGTKASEFKPKHRFAFGFINLETGEPILLDLSKKQAQAIAPIIRKNEKKLGKKYFEITKSGENTSTVVSITPEDIEDLNAAERKNFDQAPDEFPVENIQEAYFKMDESKQVEALRNVGFDVSLIGYGNESHDAGPANEADANEDPTKKF